MKGDVSFKKGNVPFIFWPNVLGAAQHPGKKGTPSLNLVVSGNQQPHQINRGA